MKIKLNDSYILPELALHADSVEMRNERDCAFDLLINKNGEGSEYTGWVDYPVKYDKEEFAAVVTTAAKIRDIADVFVVIGIGGSYLGAAAAIDFFHGSKYNLKSKSTPSIYFIGNSLSGDEIVDVLALCENKRVCVNVISKSGTTTECAVAFRILHDYMKSRYSAEECRERIIVTTDAKRGALKKLADDCGYMTFTVPDDIGGRFSALSAVGLLPIAVCGADIGLIMSGAAEMREELIADRNNDACKYAIYRNYFLSERLDIEMFCSYDPAMRLFGEWWKQLFGESEGKQRLGIFPATAMFTTDLHSMGQYIQDGRRAIFETVLYKSRPADTIAVPRDPADSDSLNYLAGKDISYINEKAFLGTLFAHRDGGVPTLLVEFDSNDEKNFGALIYFFCFACGISAYMLGVNPFDQPGVEDYKKNMFALLGKTGYEDVAKRLMKKMNN